MTTCPEFAAMELAEELFAKFGHLHQDRDWTAGHLKITREVTVRAHELLPCEPVVNTHGVLTCPLEGVIGSAVRRAMLSVKGAGAWAVPLDELHAGAREPVGGFL